MRCPARILTLALAAVPLYGQWQMQTSNTTADLRGIHNVGNGVAWASGTHGTVLRTEDEGHVWQTCAVPPGAEKLDFRGVQAFDANTAIVMSSGPGDQSRLYKTTDGCHTWKLVFTNPDAPNGFWDAVVARAEQDDSEHGCGNGSKMITGTILGDPAVHKANQYDTTQMPSFYLADFAIGIGCDKKQLSRSVSSMFAIPGEGAFAASNSILAVTRGMYWLGVGTRLTQFSAGSTKRDHWRVESYCDIAFPVSHRSPSSGIFSFAIKSGSLESLKPVKIGGFDWKAPHCRKADIVAVGGDYKAPDDSHDTAAFTAGSSKFHPARTPPHGYRSAVAYDEQEKLWITVGPNGTDVSTDDGRNWRAVHPDKALGEAPDADKNWNALSLPFVVGPHGRIGRLEPAALGIAIQSPVAGKRTKERK